MDDNHPAEDVVDHPEEEEMGGEKEESMMVVEAGEGSGSALVEHDERGEDMLGNSEAGPSHEGKRVKVGHDPYTVWNQSLTVPCTRTSQLDSKTLTTHLPILTLVAFTRYTNFATHHGSIEEPAIVKAYTTIH